MVVDGGPPPGRAADALRSLLAGDIAVISARDGAAGLPRALLGARAALRVPRARAAGALAAAGRARAAPSLPDRSRALDACAALVVGEHDFGAFTPAATPGARTRRHVTACAWRADGDELVLAIEADAFLHHMVRTLVGTMLQAGAGRARRRVVRAPARRARRGRSAGPTAPPHALTLTGVRYAGDGAGQRPSCCASSRASAAGARELLVARATMGPCGVPRGTFEPEERIDAAAHREVCARTGDRAHEHSASARHAVGRVGRPLSRARTRVVWLRAPAGLADSWELAARGASCRFVPLPHRAGCRRWRRSSRASRRPCDRRVTRCVNCDVRVAKNVHDELYDSGVTSEQYLSIGQLAARSGRSRRTIDFYSRNGLLPFVRSEGGRRLYSSRRSGACR